MTTATKSLIASAEDLQNLPSVLTRTKGERNLLKGNKLKKLHQQESVDRINATDSGKRETLGKSTLTKQPKVRSGYEADSTRAYQQS